MANDSASCAVLCNCGIILPLTDETDWDTGTRALLYLIGLLYCFLGIAIAADVFMCAIERITSSTRRVRIMPSPEQLADADDASETAIYVEQRVWNPTVANLTLMALGSSAPEILLACIEIIGKGFMAGELGPGTIVGSAAFNLMCITAVCVMAIASPGTRKIEQIGVFAVTASFSVFAYIWLLFILKVTSPEEVTVIEGALTLVFFVVLVVLAYLMDIKIYNKFRKTKSSKKAGSIELNTEAADQAAKTGTKAVADYTSRSRRVVTEYDPQTTPKLKRRDKTRTPLLTNVEDVEEGEPLQEKAEEHDPWFALQEYGWKPNDQQLREMQRQLHLQYPGLPPDELAKMLSYRISQNERHNRAWYRVQATRSMFAAKKKENYWDPGAAYPVASSASVVSLPGISTKQRVIEFSARIYAVDPKEKRVRLKVVRRGRNSKRMTFTFTTVNGVAKKGTHYMSKKETMRFEPGESTKEISVELVDGAEWKQRDVFYVHLGKDKDTEEESKTELGPCKVAEVSYLADESQNVLAFVKNHATVEESSGYVRLGIRRQGAYSKKCAFTYETEDVTANDGHDYEGGSFEGEFDEWEVEKYVDIGIIDDLEEEKDETFKVHLRTASPGSLGDIQQATVTILSDDETMKFFRNVDRVMPKMMTSLTHGSRSWKEQMIAAVNVNAGDIDDASFGDCIAHIIAFPWKVIFAFVPPATIAGGWLTFVVALALIGVITAIVGDLASIFGCLLGIPDSITAITLVALGTSLPDTFASRLAATQDKHADNAVGNVTGSNSVNVFLGLGLPWFIAACYHAAKGTPGGFHVPAGSLVFSVLIYTICSLLTIGLLMARRFLGWFGKAELGGPTVPKILSAVVLIALWLFYILMSCLRSTNVIKF